MITPPETVARMASMYESGKSLEYIGIEFGMTAAGVLYHFRKQGVDRRKRGWKSAPQSRNPVLLKRIKMLRDKQYTRSEIASILRVTIHQVNYMLRHYSDAKMSQSAPSAINR